MSSAVRVPVAGSQSAGFFRTNVIKAPGVVAARSRVAVKPQALFGGLFGGGSKASTGSSYYICIDCGYIYDGQQDFKSLPGSYKCPACNSPKSRFKTYKGEVKGRPSNTGPAMKKRMQERQW